jgi:hypothetical protein
MKTPSTSKDFLEARQDFNQILAVHVSYDLIILHYCNVT